MQVANEQLLGKWHGMVVFSVCISLDLEEDTCDCSQGYVGFLRVFGRKRRQHFNHWLITNRDDGKRETWRLTKLAARSWA
jgi:hypothetical protein